MHFEPELPMFEPLLIAAAATFLVPYREAETATPPAALLFKCWWDARSTVALWPLIFLASFRSVRATYCSD